MLKKFFNKSKTNKFKQTPTQIEEENIKINQYGEKISKELNVFYNPVMKLNRDISLLVIKTFFDQNKKPIKFCDPMGASGIRELRFLKTIPQCFEKIVMGDISKTAIEETKKNFKLNKISTKKITFLHQNAQNTINSEYFHFIEIDPFGSPIPFLDSALQRIKHNSILSVTATDTAALCGTYPKTTLRKYNIKLPNKTLYYEEIGLRNLIAYCQTQASKYEMSLTPLISYTQDHYYKIFFLTEQNKEKALNDLKNLKYIKYDRESQNTQILDLELEKGLYGKTYIGTLNNKEFIKNLKSNLNLIKNNKKISKLLDLLEKELDIVGYYNPYQFSKIHKFPLDKKFEEIFQKLKEKGFKVSKPHNNRLAIKTTATPEEFLKVLKN